jgi:hypothetical protein
MPLYTVKPFEDDERSKLLATVENALALFASAIKLGEPFTSYCESEHANAKVAILALASAPPRLLDFPSANQALLHVARPMLEVKLVKSVSAVAKLLAAGVQIESADADPVGAMAREEVPDDPPVEQEETPAPVLAPSGDKPASEAAPDQPTPASEAPAPSEALIAAEAGRRSLFERMSALSKGTEIAAKAGGDNATASPGGGEEAAEPPGPAASEDAPGVGIDAPGQQGGADQQKEEPAPSETTRPEPMF